MARPVVFHGSRRVDYHILVDDVPAAQALRQHYRGLPLRGAGSIIAGDAKGIGALLGRRVDFKPVSSKEPSEPVAYRSYQRNELTASILDGLDSLGLGLSPSVAKTAPLMRLIAGLHRWVQRDHWPYPKAFPLEVEIESEGDAGVHILDPVPYSISQLSRRPQSPSRICPSWVVLPRPSGSDELTRLPGDWKRRDCLLLLGGAELDLQSVTWSDLHAEVLEKLKRCALTDCMVVVHFGSAGVLFVKPMTRRGKRGVKDAKREVLVFHWEDVAPDRAPWTPPGQTPAMSRPWIAAITRCLSEGQSSSRLLPAELVKEDLRAIASEGLWATRLLDTVGYVRLEQREDGGKISRIETSWSWIGSVMNRLLKDTGEDKRRSLRRIVEISGDRVARELECLVTRAPAQVLKDKEAAELLKTEWSETEGPGTKAVPVGWWRPYKTFGKYVASSPEEIRSLLALDLLIKRYDSSQLQRPTSIVVVAAPGTGKSFAVREVAAACLGSRFYYIEANLTQLSGEDALWTVLEEARTVCLRGSMPVVFFDEFDCQRDGQPLGWLRSFLAPMQDGNYWLPTGERPIGRCLFFFAGGVLERGDIVGKRKTRGSPKVKNLKQLGPAELTALKFPDFISRIDLTVDLGMMSVEKRVLLLHGMLREAKVKRVSEVALEQLLREPIHGARSLRRVIDACDLSRSRVVEMRSLPPKAVLDGHLV